MLTLGPSTSFASPKPKPVTLASNTIGAAAANSGYAGVQAAFPSATANYSGIAAAFPSFTAPPVPAATGGGAGAAASLGTLSALGGGNASDYSQQLADLVAPTARAVSAQAVTNAANLSAQRKQAIITFGYVPANLSGQLQGDVNADFDPSTPGGQEARQLAAASTASGVSTYAQLQKAYHDQQASDWASLAARNMVHSGAAGQHAQADLLDYNQGYEGSMQKLMDYLQQAYQTKLTADATGQQSLSDATDKALQQIIAAIQANQYYAAQTAQQQPSYDGGGGQAQISVAGGPVAALSQPGAVGAMGGPAPYANAMLAAAPKKAAPKPYQPLVGRDY